MKLQTRFAARAAGAMREGNLKRANAEAKRAARAERHEKSRKDR